MRKYSMLACLLSVAFLALPTNAQTTPFRFAGVDVPAPLPVQNVQDVYWGKTVDDPYRFLEQVKDPSVVNWMRGQADTTDAILKRLPGRQTVFNSLKEKD